MGSSLTIVNDTDYEWYCKPTNDPHRLETTAWVIGIGSLLTGVLIAVATAGLAIPISLIALATGEIVVTGLSHEALQPLNGVVVDDKVVAPKHSPSTFTQSVTKVLQDQLVEKGFIMIKPRQKQSYENKGLSWWRQNTCVYIETKNATNLVLHTLYMRIASDKTSNSTEGYSIDYWLKKDGLTEQTSITGIEGRNDLKQE